VTFTGTSLVVTIAAWSSLLSKYATVETETMTASGVLRVAIPACDALFIGVATTTVDDYVIAARLSDSVTGGIGKDGAPGADGADGEDGLTVLSGAGAPAPPPPGVNGDLYVDLTAFELYKMVTGSWVSQGVFKGTDGSDGLDGSDGADGATWYADAGAPDNGDGVDGDLYLNTTNGDVYQKAAGTWGVIANISGGDSVLELQVDGGILVADSGGDTRGEYAVDLQTVRTSVGQVA
jgi:hypothetical protein